MFIPDVPALITYLESKVYTAWPEVEGNLYRWSPYLFTQQELACPIGVIHPRQMPVGPGEAVNSLAWTVTVEIALADRPGQEQDVGDSLYAKAAAILNLLDSLKWSEANLSVLDWRPIGIDMNTELTRTFESIGILGVSILFAVEFEGSQFDG